MSNVNIEDRKITKNHGGVLGSVSAADAIAHNLPSRVNAYGIQNGIQALSNRIFPTL